MLALGLHGSKCYCISAGIYFNSYQIDKGLANPEQAPFLVEDRLNGLRKFGGVRIEDVVYVTADGIENLTTVPRDIERVEQICQGGYYDPVSGKVGPKQPEGE